jgi:L-glyceraldehyde 3-phosphate reductase
VADNLSLERLAKLEALNALAKERGQTLAQMSLAWLLRLPEVTSALIGASSLPQIQENVAALQNLTFTEAELSRIDELFPA